MQRITKFNVTEKNDNNSFRKATIKGKNVKILKVKTLKYYELVMCTKRRFTDAKKHKLKKRLHVYSCFGFTVKRAILKSQKSLQLSVFTNIVNTCVSSMFPTLFHSPEKKIVQENLLNCTKVISEIYQNMKFGKVMKKSNH